jgi:hypothetical protein
MSAALKTSHVTVADKPDDGELLKAVIARMEVVEAKQGRPSPVHLRTWEEIERFADRAARSGMVPKDFVGKPDAIVIAVQMGSELGLAPMQALQNIAVVNGRPALWGDALPGLCRASGVAASIREWSSGEGDNLTFFCEAIRKDDPSPVIGRFSVADAKRANLWKETPKTKRQGREGPYEVDSGPWYSYPNRMLQMRARGFCLRDAFPDVLKGLVSVEEAQDIPFSATGLTLRQEPEHRPSEPPPTPEPRRPTVTEWLKALDAELAQAQTSTEVDAILARDDVQKAQDKLTNGAKDRLQDMLDAAIKRTTPAPVSDEGPAFEDDDLATDAATQAAAR